MTQTKLPFEQRQELKEEMDKETHIDYTEKEEIEIEEGGDITYPSRMQSAAVERNIPQEQLQQPHVIEHSRERPTYEEPPPKPKRRIVFRNESYYLGKASKHGSETKISVAKDMGLISQIESKQVKGQYKFM